MAPTDEIQVGDLVNVPGSMHGTVRYLGSVAGKQGRFAGVELAPEYAGKGKNNGAVDGRQYFTTASASSGIFVPMSGKYVTKRAASTSQTPAKPTTANFSKSVGPGTAPPTSAARPKFRRPSLPRPESPGTKASPPKLNLTGSRAASAFTKPPTPSNGSSGPRTPIRGLRTPSRPPSSISVDDNTPTGVRRSDRSDVVSTPALDDREAAERIKSLEQQLKDRDKQLEEQANTLSELQQSITELEGADGQQVRAQLREKNEKIASLTAEFDSHRADFRSTLDTLEVAATETERVYEKRIEELLQSNRELQDRGEDVEAVAAQLKQLEELVSELEEGLEESRRGEAEARGEVEFLRGEVERAKLELNQEKEKSAAALKEAGASSEGGASRSASKDIDQKDDEIRGLKAIIHSLSRGDPSSQALMQQNGMTSGNNSEETKRVSQMEKRMQELESLTERKDHRIGELENQLRELQEDAGAHGRAASGRNMATSPLNIRKHQQSDRSNEATHSHTLSDRTVVPPDWNDSPSASNNPPMPQLSPSNSRRQPDHYTGRSLATMQESDSHSSGTDDGGALWCEICETSGHDILTCTNMFGSAAGNSSSKPALQNTDRTSAGAATNTAGGGAGPTSHYNESASRNMNGLKSATSPRSQRTGKDAVLEGLKGIGSGSGRRFSTSMTPVAGKASGIIDETKWCALCERDGHESIDCPFDE